MPQTSEKAVAVADANAEACATTTAFLSYMAEANAEGLKLEQREERPMEKWAPDNTGSDIGASAGIPDGGSTAAVPCSNRAIQWDSNHIAEYFVPSPDDLDDLPGAEARGRDNSPSASLQPVSLSTSTATTDASFRQEILEARTDLVLGEEAVAQHSVSTVQGHAIHNQAVAPPSTLQERFAELTARTDLVLREEAAAAAQHSVSTVQGHANHRNQAVAPLSTLQERFSVPSLSAAAGQQPQPLPNVGTTPKPPLPPLPPHPPSLPPLLSLPPLTQPQPPLTAMMAAATSAASTAVPSLHTLTLVDKAAYVQSQLGLDEGMTLPQQDSNSSIASLFPIPFHPPSIHLPPLFSWQATAAAQMLGAAIGGKPLIEQFDKLLEMLRGKMTLRGGNS